MKKIKISSYLAAGVAAAVQISNNQAFAKPVASVTFTNETDYASYSDGGSVTVPISPAIGGANELVSISEGSAGSYESGSFALTVDYSNDTTEQLYSTSSSALNVQFTSITDESFNAGTIDGLTFTYTGENQEHVPVGTIFAFDVPEPASLSLLAVGGAGAWLAARRRNGKQV